MIAIAIGLTIKALRKIIIKMGNCCLRRNQRPSNRIKNDESVESSFLLKMRNKFMGQPAKLEKFVVFGQDRSGYEFFLQLDSTKMTLQQQNLPTGSNFYNYSGVTMVDDDTMVVCGGIKYNLNGITQECLEYKFSTQSCRRLAKMHDIRYTFPIVHKEGKIYAIGGRVYGDDTVSLLKKCEYYDRERDTWKKIADMNIPRCTSSAFIYNGEIWVIGGYTGRYQRSKKIEKYIESEDRWELLDFKLFFGFENGNVVPTGRPNEIMVLGGKMNFGNSNNVWCYDLLNKTIINRKPVTNNCILTKYQILDNNNVVILGENSEKKYFYETYNIPTSSHHSGTFKVKRNTLEKFKQYNFNTPNIELRYDPSYKFSYENRNYGQKNIIFGTDQEPFQMEVDMNTKDISIFPIPCKLKLRNFQGVCRINDNELFFCGGINITFQRISSKAFIYNLEKREITNLVEMRRMRYTFPTIFHNNCVYVIGGREYGSDNFAIYSDVERFNFDTNMWEAVAGLNIPRCTSNAFKIKGQIYVAGGYCRNSKRTDTIEVYNEDADRWEVMGFFLPQPLEAAFFVNRDNSIFYCGGRSEKGDMNEKYWFNVDKGDFEVVERISDNLVNSLCLQKVVYVRDVFFVFGSIAFDKINAIHAKDFTNLKKKQVSMNDMVVEGGSEPTIGITYDHFKDNLKGALKSISFGNQFIKRNSYVLPTQFS